MLILEVSPILEPDRDSVHGHPRDIEELAISDFGCPARRIAGTSTRFASISLMQCTYETVGCRKLIYNIYFNLVWENNFPSHEESIFFGGFNECNRTFARPGRTTCKHPHCFRRKVGC